MIFFWKTQWMWRAGECIIKHWQNEVKIKHYMRSIFNWNYSAGDAGMFFVGGLFFFIVNKWIKKVSHCLFAQIHISHFQNLQASLVVISILYSYTHHHYQYLIPTETTAQLVRKTVMRLCRVWDSTSRICSVQFLIYLFQ